MANRQVFPSSIFPLRGDISAETGATSVIVQGIQGIPVISPPVEPIGLDTLFYDSYNNDWFYASPWDIPVGTPLVWEGYGYGSSGISWIAPDTLAFGNGTDGDVSGAAAMTALVLFGSASYYGPYNDYDVDYGPSYDQFYTSIFSGATQNWNLILPPNPGTSGQVLTTNGTGVSYWSTISGGGGGTPGGTPTQIQFNNSGAFGGIPGSSVDGINGLMGLAPTGTGVALSVTGDAAGDHIQEWYVNGAASPGASFTTDGDSVGVQLYLQDSTLNNYATLDPINGLTLNNTTTGFSFLLDPGAAGIFEALVKNAIVEQVSVAATGLPAFTILGDQGLDPLLNLIVYDPSYSSSPVLTVDAYGETSIQPISMTSATGIAALAVVGDSYKDDIQDWYVQDIPPRIQGPYLAVQVLYDGTVYIAPAPIGTPSGNAALTLVGDAASHALQNWFVNGGSSPVISVDHLGNLHLSMGLYDGTNSIGTAGQVLSSTGTEVKWIAASGGAPGGSTGDIQYNNSGSFGGSAATITAAGSMTVPEGQVIKWSGSAYSGVGLSILAADTLAVGNGTASDVSGGMAMTALILYGSSYYSAYDAYQTTILSGALQDWSLVLPETAGIAGQVLTNIGSGFTAWESLTTIGVPWSSLTNPTTNLSLIMGTDTTTFNYATGLASAWTWQNNTPTVTGASTTVALSTSTAPTHSGGVSWTYTLAASESGAGSNGWLGALVTISGYTGGATGNNGASLLVTASTTTTVTLSNPTGTTINTGTPVMISSAVSSSPILQIAGTVNTGTAGTLNSVTDGWSLQVVPASVAPNPISQLVFTHSGSTNNQTAIIIPAIGQGTVANRSLGWAGGGGGIGAGIGGANSTAIVTTSSALSANFDSNGVQAPTAGLFAWGASNTSATKDTGLSRISAGIVGVGTGLAASIAGSIQCASIALNGAVASPTAGVYYSGTNAGITQTAEAVGTLATTGGIVTTFTAVSDERLKNWDFLDYGLDEILAINPIKFRWNELGAKYSGQSTERDFVGFSAQNVEKVIPEATWVSKDGFLGFDDRPVIAALVNAIKELEARLRKAGL